MSTTFFISAGHSNVPGKDRGAAAGGYVEGIEAVHLRNIVAENLRAAGHQVIEDTDSMVTGEMASYFDAELVKTTGRDVVVDIHFNAATPQATGTEVLTRVNATRDETALASRLSVAISQALGIRNRGVKTEAQSARGRLHIFSKLSATEATVVLIEVCFITNPDDMLRYSRNVHGVGKAISDVLSSNV